MRYETHFYCPASPDDARRVIDAQGQQRNVVVYIRETRIKHTPRRMVCRFDPEAAARQRIRYDVVAAQTMIVWDIEVGELRTIALDQVTEIRWNAPVHEPRRDPSIDRETARRAFEETRRQLHELFD